VLKLNLNFLKALGVFLLIALILLINSPFLQLNIYIRLITHLFFLWSVFKLGDRVFVWLIFLHALFLAEYREISFYKTFCIIGLVYWANLKFFKNQAKKYILFLLFFFVLILDLYGFSYYDLGSLHSYIAFLPLLNQASGLISIADYVISILIASFTRKTNIVIAILSQLFFSFKWYLVLPLSVALISCGFIFQEKLSHFINNSILTRFGFWKAVINATIHKPLWGYGLDALPHSIAPFRPDNIDFPSNAIMQFSYAHSTLFDLIFSYGILGLVLYFAFMYLCFKSSKPLFLTILLLSLFDSLLYYPAQVFLLIIIVVPLLKAEHKVFKFIVSRFPLNVQLLLKIVLVIVSIFVVLKQDLAYYNYANADYKKAIDLYSSNAHYHFVQGVNYYFKKDYLNAQESYLRSVKINPDIGYVYGFLAAVQFSLKDYQSAKESANLSLRLGGHDPQWLFNSAQIIYDFDKEIAMQYLDKAISSKPSLIGLLKYNRVSEFASIGGTKSTYWIKNYNCHLPMIPLPIVINKRFIKYLNDNDLIT
jgi:tetratricopeptide (TPR) repeat protein